MYRRHVVTLTARIVTPLKRKENQIKHAQFQVPGHCVAKAPQPAPMSVQQFRMTRATSLSHTARSKRSTILLWTVCSCSCAHRKLSQVVANLSRSEKKGCCRGKLLFSDAELVQNFSSSEAIPVSDHSDQLRDYSFSPDRRPGMHTRVCTDIHVTSWATSVLSGKNSIKQLNKEMNYCTKKVQSLDTTDDATTKMHS